jgi:hypothetical protein
MKNLAIVAIVVLSATLTFGQQTTPGNPEAKDAQPPRSHNNKGQAVTGKTQANHGIEKPRTTVGSVGQTTPGAETEAGVEQQPGGNSDVSHTGPANPNANRKSKTVQPTNLMEAGQNADQADLNAQAAQRAEIVPGHTQGVEGQTGNVDIVPSKGSRAGAQSPTLPQGEAQAGKGKNATQKKTGTAQKSNTKKSTTNKPSSSTSTPQ